MRKELQEEKSHRADARVIAVSEYPVYRVPSQRFRRWLRDAKAPAPVAPGIGYRAVLRAVGGHALHGGTCYRLQERFGTRVVLSVRTPEGVKVKTVRAAQVALTKAGAVLRTEVNRAIAVTGRVVRAVAVGDAVPCGADSAIEKGQVAEARVGGRRVRGIVTTLWSSGDVGIGTEAGVVRRSARQVRVLARARGCLMFA